MAVAFQQFNIQSPSDFDALASALPDCYAPEEVIEQLKEGLDERCACVIVESFYVDKDYRSTYYNYYAKKGYRYESNCIRLHFIDRAVELRDYALRIVPGSPAKSLSEAQLYFGYMVLRPTLTNTIGRTVLTPAAIKGFHGSIIGADHKVHLLGEKLVVNGFPYMSQHIDISVCAHAACWAILRHYSERFSRHAEFLTYDITRMAQEFDPGGLVPSTGLHMGHAERVFASARTFPMLVLKEDAEPGLFHRQLFAYVKSGFPLFAEIERIGHAVAIVGHTGTRALAKRSAPCHFASDLIEGLVVIDDNYLPYRVAPVGQAEPYGCCDFSAFIVPLPEKVYYPADSVDDLALLLANEEHLEFNHDALGSPYIRYFLTTAAAFRRFTHDRRSQFDPDLIKIVMELSFPQFIWVIEIASPEQWKNGQIETRIIVDATASPHEKLPIFLMHNSKRAYVCDRGADHDEFIINLTPPGGAPLSHMPGNLKTH